MPMTPYIGNASAPATATSDKPVLVDIQGMPDPFTATDGQLMIGDTGVGMVLNTLASADSSVTITNGAGTINLAVAVAAVIPTIQVIAGTGGATYALGATPAQQLIFLNSTPIEEGAGAGQYSQSGANITFGANVIPIVGDIITAVYWD